MNPLTCPECGEEVWDGPRGHKLAKCWGCGTAFDTMEDRAPYQPLRSETVNELNHYVVSLHEEPGDTFIIRFECEAEDPDHAADQAESAYPGCKVVNVTFIEEEEGDS